MAVSHKVLAGLYERKVAIHILFWLMGLFLRVLWPIRRFTIRCSAIYMQFAWSTLKYGWQKTGCSWLPMPQHNGHCLNSGVLATHHTLPIKHHMIFTSLNRWRRGWRI